MGQASCCFGWQERTDAGFTEHQTQVAEVEGWESGGHCLKEVVEGVNIP